MIDQHLGEQRLGTGHAAPRSACRSSLDGRVWVLQAGSAPTRP
jgi:hypothetical protein